jgi:hypothetical protein
MVTGNHLERRPLRNHALHHRRQISPEFVEEVAEWLSGAGITLFFADSTMPL